MQDLPNGGGGRRSKHWPPGAGDPRYATALTLTTDASDFGWGCIYDGQKAKGLWSLAEQSLPISAKEILPVLLAFNPFVKRKRGSRPI